jgi:hypothetical protein
MAGCLAERERAIVGWEKAGKKMKVDPMAKKKKPKARAAGRADPQDSKTPEPVAAPPAAPVQF